MTEVYDYKTHEIRDVATGGPARPLPEPSGDMLIFHTEAGGLPVRRPALGDRAEDQVLPLRPDRHARVPTDLSAGQGDDRAAA